MSGEQARLARVALGWFGEPGHQGIWRRVAAHGPAAVLEGLLHSDAAAKLAGQDPWRLAEDALAATRRLGARVVIPEDDEWPSPLDDLAQIAVRHGQDPVDINTAPPLALWVRGPWRLDEAVARSVAVVGSRAATGYGSQVARQIGYGLAERDWCVVSGGAYGVDAYAHRGALAAGGTTMVVLACGIDRPYPVSHANLFDRVSEDGLLVSEWAPGADPYPYRFLIRNRVIAAATAGTVMVEASARSGARQTLRRAGQLLRHRMAVPGPVTSALSAGCHEELREPGVTLVTGVAHILELVGTIGGDLAPMARGPVRDRDHLDPVARALVESLLKRKPLSCEEVAERARVPVREAMRILPSLVYQGHARRLDHGYVVVSGPARGNG